MVQEYLVSLWFIYSWLLLALQVKVGKVALFVGKIFVLQCSTTKITRYTILLLLLFYSVFRRWEDFNWCKCVSCDMCVHVMWCHVICVYVSCDVMWSLYSCTYRTDALCSPMYTITSEHTTCSLLDYTKHTRPFCEYAHSHPHTHTHTHTPPTHTHSHTPHTHTLKAQYQFSTFCLWYQFWCLLGDVPTN